MRYNDLKALCANDFKENEDGMKRTIRACAFFLCFAILFVSVGCTKRPATPPTAEEQPLASGGETTNPEQAEEEDGVALTDLDFLITKGSKIINRGGEEVILRGVNLGGWLLQECWMCPVAGEDGEWGNLDTIEAFSKSGMSAEQIQALFETYQENWITEYDLDIIAASNVNCVRVPFWYRNFMTDEAGTWIAEDPNENPGFQALDRIIREAGERGLYVILDLHGCPGGQSMNHCCGTVGRKDLYTDPVCRETMKTLWVAIATRYKDSPVVAAYDLMNEPQNNGGFESEEHYVSPWDPASWEETNELYDEMIRAVRAVDEKHIISVEGIWRVTNLPLPSETDWTNMLYQVHLYDSTASFHSLCAELQEYSEQNAVPIYVGEFSNMDGIHLCETYGLHWTTWSYKGGKGEIGDWFWYSASPAPVVPGETTFEEALVLWGEALRTENGFVSCEKVISTVEAVTKKA